MDEWRPVPGSADFVRTGMIAVYKRTVNGYALYWVFDDALPARKRVQRNALFVGGLPSAAAIARVTQ